MKGQLAKLKAEYVVSPSSETVLGLPEPPSHMCSDLDGIIGIGDMIISRLDDALHSDNDPFDYIDMAMDEARKISSDVEMIRSQVEDLRAWGQHWKDLAKNLLEHDSIDLEDEI